MGYRGGPLSYGPRDEACRLGEGERRMPRRVPGPPARAPLPLPPLRPVSAHLPGISPPLVVVRRRGPPPKSRLARRLRFPSPAPKGGGGVARHRCGWPPPCSPRPPPDRPLPFSPGPAWLAHLKLHPVPAFRIATPTPRLSPSLSSAHPLLVSWHPRRRQASTRPPLPPDSLSTLPPHPRLPCRTSAPPANHHVPSAGQRGRR